MRWGIWLLAAGVAGCEDWVGPQGGRAESGGVAVEWHFPLLVNSPASEWTLPSYLAHLTGKVMTDGGRLDVACATVHNPGPEAVDLRLQVRLPVYGQAGESDLEVGAGETADVCANPIFDFRQLYALRTYAPASLEAVLSTEANAEIASQRLDVAIAPSNEILFDIPGLSGAGLRDLSVVFVTPDEPVVDQVLRQAFAASTFRGFDSVDAYERDPYTRHVTLSVGERSSEVIRLETDEAVTWTVEKTDVDGLEASLENANGQVVLRWSALKSGVGGHIQPGSGSYRLVWHNDGTHEGTLAWSRNNTREDVARDALQAVFRTISSHGARYSNVGRSYFDGWQRVRRPAESLEAQATNCVDGSFLFASVLELLGMEPVILWGVGHAYVGVRASRGGNQVWAIETTGVGVMDAEAAYRIAQDRVARDAATPDFALTDVRVMRTRGVLPFPQ